jgi:hypothetical protein
MVIEPQLGQGNFTALSPGVMIRLHEKQLGILIPLASRSLAEPCAEIKASTMEFKAYVF